MSFIDTLGGLAKGAYTFLSGKSIGSSLARTALLGYALNRINASANKANEQKDPGTEVLIDPDTEYKIPVVYGSAYVTGKITDAVMADNNTTMWLCLTLCEKTGKLIDNTPSSIAFNEVYFNNFRLSFGGNGYSVDYMWDDSNNNSDVWANQIEVYPFSGGSTSPVSFSSEGAGNTQNAYNIMPGWTSNHTMDNLVFCIVKINYSKFKKLTNIGEMKFKLTNTMSQPGDVLYDYMTNTRYGAGIPSQEIYKS